MKNAKKLISATLSVLSVASPIAMTQANVTSTFAQAQKCKRFRGGVWQSGTRDATPKTKKHLKKMKKGKKYKGEMVYRGDNGRWGLDVVVYFTCTKVTNQYKQFKVDEDSGYKPYTYTLYNYEA